MAKKNRQNDYPDVRPWVKVAVAEESRRPGKQLWKGEPTPEQINKEQAKRVRFLRKNGKTSPRAEVLADRLGGCQLDQRCLSGACPQCAQLLQRWLVRRSKKFIADHLEAQQGELVAISIIPPRSAVTPGQLNSFSIINFQRRLKYILAKADVPVAIGAIVSNILEPTFLSDFDDCRQEAVTAGPDQEMLEDGCGTTSDQDLLV